ncbi:MAG: adenylosuccinate synthetase [Desulfomicrobiaceae bacterium]|jgi:adenylosuccinate synthase|nr:adenylosuccinate synthase [Desulfomicrobiaceae bacterium]MBZ4684369.1 adenylosuccinate synthetase [Desulfomicrobiaceae bacterium]MDI3492184.1 adenylosuccinate synthase [Desulfomicrobiaceae bacterium]MDK2872685.1 adenylosuccinate synthase [Desulfomicrobiaceae bacterium]
MAGIVVVGAQWGDEGKGKIVDLLTAQVSAIVRFQGGNNAGHTLVVGGARTVLHLIPSGILHPGKLCLIGNGVVLDPFVFCQELDTLAASGVDVRPSRLRVSRKAHIIMEYHRLLDAAREAFKSGADKIGTTGRGIGPCYEDKAARVGIRAADLADEALLRRKIEKALVEKNALLTGLYGQDAVDAEAVWQRLVPVARRIVPYLDDVSEQVAAALPQGVLFEGAQGTHLDIDHGTYPFVTSSNTVAGNAAAGAGCAPAALSRIIGIVKAYTTRVGAGPFPTELTDAVGDLLQERGQEFGATTGRRRRCGWLDAVVLRESVRVNGLTEIALTKLDVLSGVDPLRIAVAYRADGREVAYPPQGENAMAAVEPVYETLPGWREDISGCRSFAELPLAAQNYVRRIEELAGVPVRLIAVGPDREQTIAVA